MNHLNFKYFASIKREHIYMLLLAIYMLSYPLTYNLNSQAIIALSIFFLIDNANNLKQKFKKLKTNKLILVLVIYVFIQALGLFFTEDMVRGSQVLVRDLPLIFLPIVLFVEPISKKNIGRLKTIFKLSLIVTIFYFFISQFIIEDRALGTMVHFALKSIDISQHNISILFVLAILFCLHDLYNKSQVIFNIACVIPLVFCLLLLSSRISILILALCLVIFFLQNFNNYGFLKKVLLLSFFSCLLLIVFFTSPDLQNKTNRLIRSTDFDIEVVKTKNSVTYAKNTVEHRVLMNLCSINIIMQNPFLGVGTGDYLNALLEEYRNINFKAGKLLKFNAHNQYLQDFIKNGVLGFFSYLLIVILVFKKGLHNKKYILYGAVALLLLSFTESILARQHGVGFLAFYIPFLYLTEKLE